MKTILRKRLSLSALFLVLIVGPVLAQRTSTYPTTGEITSNAVNVRQSPGIDRAHVLLLYKGDKIRVLGQKADWYEIELPDDSPLWVYKDYVRRGTGGAGEINGTSVHVRHGAGSAFKSMGIVHTGRKVRIMGEQGDWLKVTYLSSDHGYVNIRYAILSGHSKPIEAPTKSPAPPMIGKEQTSVLVMFKQAEGLYTAEVNKASLEDWNLAEVEKLYKQIQEKASDGLISRTVAARLSYIEMVKQCQSSMVRPEEYMKRLREREAEINEEFSKKRDEILARSTRPTYLATGRVEKLVSTWLPPATHKLMEGDRIVYLLYSDKETLGVYEGRFAGILGEVDRSLKYNTPTVKVGDIDILEEVEESQKDE